MKFVDIHIHCLPGLDDGSRNEKETLEIIKQEKNQGVGAIIATPHSSAFNYLNCYYVNELVQKYSSSDLQIFLGCEIYSPQYLMNHNLSMLAKGLIPSMNMSKYILVEFDLETKCKIVDLICTEYDKNGWIPIIAHAERYDLGLQDVSYLKEKGYKVQVNAYSLYDEQKEKTKNRAIRLLENNKIDLIGSDTHRLDHRPPCVINGINQVINTLNKKDAENILYNNANNWFELNL